MDRLAFAIDVGCIICINCERMSLSSAGVVGVIPVLYVKHPITEGVFGMVRRRREVDGMTDGASGAVREPVGELFY